MRNGSKTGKWSAWLRQISIRTKITIITAAAIFVSVLAIGGLGVAFVRETVDRTAEETMRLICDNRRQTINEYLYSIEQSVEMAALYAGGDLSSVELMSGGVVGSDGWGDSLPARTDAQRALLNRYLQAHSQRVETVCRSVASHTNGVLTYYYRFNPEFSDEVRGFWYAKMNGEEFTGENPTEIPAYSQDDISHVGWYYIPLLRGEPTWMEPYYNENLGALMVSYIIPVYKAGTFIGIIGMDIRYETLVGQIKNMRIYDTGFAMLAQADGTVVYHPTMAMGTRLSEDPSLSDIVGLLMEEESSSGSPLRYSREGEERMLVFSTLSNGMKLVVVAPVREINASWMRLLRVILLAAALIMAAFVAFTMLILKRITEPLQHLTAASRLLAEGNYDITLDDTGGDEVGVLTAAFQQLVNHLRDYITDLNSRAYQDAMTGVKNKGAYTAAAVKLNDSIRLGGDALPEFGIVMLDCNNLKLINDTYGHEHGDQYLRASCELICQTFTHSPVFRVGGDEFAVILQKDDYIHRKELMVSFDRMAAEINARAGAPWEQVSIAKGMAAYKPETDKSVENVMERADERMYENKIQMKGGRR